jgi:hypothetical protein
MADSLLNLRTPEEAAKALLRSPRTLERWRTNGTGPDFVRLGRLVAYTDGALNAYVARQVNAPPPRRASQRTAAA